MSMANILERCFLLHSGERRASLSRVVAALLQFRVPFSLLWLRGLGLWRAFLLRIGVPWLWHQRNAVGCHHRPEKRHRTRRDAQSIFAPPIVGLFAEINERHKPLPPTIFTRRAKTLRQAAFPVTSQTSGHTQLARRKLDGTAVHVSTSAKRTAQIAHYLSSTTNHSLFLRVTRGVGELCQLFTVIKLYRPVLCLSKH